LSCHVALLLFPFSISLIKYKEKTFIYKMISEHAETTKALQMNCGVKKGETETERRKNTNRSLSSLSVNWLPPGGSFS
jgi:hypothetical protein